MAMLETAPSQPAPHSLTALAEEAARTPLIAGGDSSEQENQPPLYAARRKVYPQHVSGTYRRVKWIVLCVTLGVYYLLPFVRWDRGPNAPGQAVLIDFPSRRFYFFFIEIWPQEFYYLTGLLILAAMALFLMNAIAGRLWCGYPLPADGLDRFVPSHRTLGRRRPARASATRSSALDDRAHCTRRRQAFPLADDRLVDRRRLGPVLRRRADAGQRPRDVSGAARRLCVHRPPDLHDLCARRMDARAGLRLHVPVATHSGGAHRRIRAQRHLSLRPRRTASIGEESSDLARARLAGRRLHRIVCNACMFARPASTSAADPMSAAFNAACASMLAMP
jgi:hypothetical protein